MILSENEISGLRERVMKLLSDRRYAHTLGVEKAALRIAEAVSPELCALSRVAALLHDVTKEMNQNELVRSYGLMLSESNLKSPETLHALTAVPYIMEHFPEFSSEDVLFAIKTHTTGSPEMSTLGKIIYVADYIEEGRRYESSRLLREELYFALSKATDSEDAKAALDRAAISSIEYTINHLTSQNKFIHELTCLTKDALKKQLRS